MNANRNATLDVARGFTVFIMPAVHSMLLYSTGKVRRSRLAHVLGFLAEGPGAQLFMFLMGVSISLGRKKRPAQLCKRSASLMAQGVLLNGLRLVLPHKMGLIPKHFLLDNGIPQGRKGYEQLLLTGDILQCAAISYLTAALLYKRRRYGQWAMLLALCMAEISPRLWERHFRYPVLKYLSALCTGRPPAVFFPVFPWITYTLAGLAWGYYLKTIQGKYLYPATAVAGLLLMAWGKRIQCFEPADRKTSFYRLGPGGTLKHLGIVLLWLCLCESAVKQVKWNRFFGLLIWLSRHITRVYFIQWILVLWLLPLFGYRRSGMFKSLVAMSVNTVLTFKAAKLKNPLLWKRSMISPGSA